MNETEFNILEDLIKSIESALKDKGTEGDSQKLYEWVNQANTLFSKYDPKITNSFNRTISLKSNSFRRESATILSLLRILSAKEGCTYQKGIIPITLENLKVCPDAQNTYRTGIEKYSTHKYDRNVLDDMRLSLEMLVKQFLGNDKSLENQKSDLGRKLKDFNISKEIGNLVEKTIDYICNYQNHHVKHDDSFISVEIDYVIEQISVVINLITKLMN